MENSRKGRKNKIGPKYGVRDYYKYYSKTNTNAIEYSLYKDILISFFKMVIVKIIYDNFEFRLPKRLGTLQLRKFQPTIKLKDGKIIKNFNPIDFKKTRLLWEKDEEARKNKILIRHLNKHSKGFIFRIKYYLTNSNYQNKKVYTFTALRSVKKEITKATHENNIDAFLN